MSITVDRQKGLSGGLAIKAPVRVATTANITLSGLQTIDGVTVVADDRVLVKNQTSGVDNGIYVASTSTWQRDKDFNGNSDIVQGTFVKIQSGTVNGSAVYEVTTSDPVIGTSSLTFSLANSVALEANLATSVGAALVGSDDGAGGSIWTTVAGAIAALFGGATSVDAGIVKSSGSALSPAVAGTDYLAPAAIGTTVQAYDADIPTVAGTEAEITTGTQTALRSWSPSVLNDAVAAAITSQTNAPTLKTAIATTSGTAHGWTAIPSWVKRITFMVAGLSTNGTSIPIIQIGDSGGYHTTGYLGSCIWLRAGTPLAVVTPTTGLGLNANPLATNVIHGMATITNINADTWVMTWTGSYSDSEYVLTSSCSIVLTTTLDRIQLTTVNGTDVCDAGLINLLLE